MKKIIKKLFDVSTKPDVFGGNVKTFKKLLILKLPRNYKTRISRYRDLTDFNIHFSVVFPRFRAYQVGSTKFLKFHLKYTTELYYYIISILSIIIVV